MFESLTDRLGKAIRNLRGVGRLTESNVEESLQEVRTALLAADVHFRVARTFVENIKKKCVGEEVLKSVTPGQQIVKILHDELVLLLGEGSREISPVRPLRVMLVGLHGAGKTTTTAKLALYLRKKGYRPGLVAGDVYRPAAIDQLETLAREGGFAFFGDRSSKDVVRLCQAGEKQLRQEGCDAILFDTAGRLQIAEDLVDEVKSLRSKVAPEEVFLVADGAIGQEAVNVAKAFHEAVGLTGIIMTKLDGDARGGAALSMKSMTGVPILFAGTGERMDALERFHPDRMASRILDMGDVVSLVEKAQENIDEEEAARMAEKMRRADFTLEDMLQQMRQVKKLGSLGSLMKMLPGTSGLEIGDAEETRLRRTEAILLSMTPKERAHPGLISGSRRLRIARGSGMEVKDVNQLLKQHLQMKKMMKKMKGAKGARMMQRLGGGMPGAGV